MLQRMLRYTRNFFNFSYAEAKGFLLMLALLIISFAAYLLYQQWPSRGYTSYIEDKALLDSLILQMKTREQEMSARQAGYKRSYKGDFKKKEEDKIMPLSQPFVFNPNTLSVDSLQLLGVPQWLARRIANFREKGGKFRKKEDLMVIYDMPDSLYQKLAPYISLPAPAFNSKPAEGDTMAKERFSNKEKAVAPFDINQADSLLLQKLRGIGPVLSSRIVRFRDNLGGFVSMDQLYEVWGLDSTVVDQIRKSAHISADFQPAQININEATQEEIAAHPYFSPLQARLLYAYRQQHGPVKSVNDLLSIHTFDPAFINKIAPYVTIE